MNNKLNRKDHGCLSACVAKYFGIPETKVPLFVKHNDYGKYLRAFFKRRGLKIEWEHFDKKLLKNKNKLYIVTGKSPRGKRIRHAVLYKGKKPYYDSHDSNLFLEKPEHIWLVTKRKTASTIK